ncbi:hypothetical protein DPMN_045562 [Dreissena polymorpha]|uniref:Uncharacterized protein n=1 Tax=Dreissena polymorpha TaxID=45954 RepID=A0A9D4D6K3_DREPO|nr:hypothetical protein DPMN_045562 [Dreissena polymorpha]
MPELNPHRQTSLPVRTKTCTTGLIYIPSSLDSGSDSMEIHGKYEAGVFGLSFQPFPASILKKKGGKLSMVCGKSLEQFPACKGKPWNIFQGFPASKEKIPSKYSMESGKQWIFFPGFSSKHVIWKTMEKIPWFSRLHGLIGQYFFHAGWKTLENVPGFSMFNIPWLPGLTWKIVQLIPWSLERKNKFLVYKTEYMHTHLLGPLLKKLAIT